MQRHLFEFPGDWPHPHDAAAADRLVERFRDLSPADAHLLSLLRCLGGNSPYLADLAIRESATLIRLRRQGPDAVAAAVLLRLRHVPFDSPRPAVASALRLAKRQIALIAGVADIGGVWPLHSVTAALSDLAEAALRLALGHLLRTAHDAGKIRLPHPARPEQGSGFVVLGMGKLGARELNYSSDIDLILIYDRRSPVYAQRLADEQIGPFTARIARDLAALMQDRDADGYVFRTDLRLRPDPAATPPAVSFESAITYYESLAQNWERAALIRARPVAGDQALGRHFLEAIRPFVWRRGLDFAAMADIHALKRRINARGGGAAPGLDPIAQIAQRDVKRGAGGIREIEFLVQTLQLVWGGRDPTVRVAPTFPALDALVAAGHLKAGAAGDLKACYVFLRQVEHRLQMVNDRQVHSFPKAGADLDRIATFLGFASTRAMATQFLTVTETVRRHDRAVFAHVPNPPSTQAIRPDLDFSRHEPEQPGTVSALEAMGYKNPAQVLSTVRDWLAGHVRALRSHRARDLMTTMVPAILTTLGRQPDPDEAFRRFDRFISALPSGVQPMSLFRHNPALLEQIALVLGGAPQLASHLARYPSALEGLLAPDDDVPALRMLESRVADTTRLEDAIQIIRRAVKEKDFLLSVATLDGRLDADAAGIQRTALADATLATLIPRVLADYASRFGAIKGGGLAVVAMGKAGGREMMVGSDLDLMLIYDHPSNVMESHGGARNLPASQWFVRATHACIAALTAPGPEGQMYAVDMRLRPSGNKGPVAVSLQGFIQYHSRDSWTWERMALTRARVVAGPPALCERVRQAIGDAIRHAGDPDKIRADAAAMRARMMRDHPHHGPWDVKLRPGGQVDVEFVAQVLQLIHVLDHPAMCSPTTGTALRNLRDAGLLPADDAAVLIKADHLWRTIQGMLRLTVGHVGPQGLTGAPADWLLRAVAKAGVQAVVIPALLLKLDHIAQQVRTIFTRHVGDYGA
jgi:glutamate-ammonia-ligase adenylyltransferase